VKKRSDLAGICHCLPQRFPTNAEVWLNPTCIIACLKSVNSAHPVFILGHIEPLKKCNNTQEYRVVPSECGIAPPETGSGGDNGYITGIVKV
jgi:hypothetical protein